MSHPNPERDERDGPDECLVSTHEFKLHDWRWLAWPLSNTSARGRWCRLCGLTQGQPDGQCQTQNCLEYAAGGNDFCEFCQQNRTINDTATRMRDRCVKRVEEMRDEWRRQANSREEFQFANDRLKRSAQANAADWIITALQSLTPEGEQEKQKPVDVCVVCKSEPVCPEEGFDTCTYCARRI